MLKHSFFGTLDRYLIAYAHAAWPGFGGSGLWVCGFVGNGTKRNENETKTERNETEETVRSENKTKTKRNESDEIDTMTKKQKQRSKNAPKSRKSQKHDQKRPQKIPKDTANDQNITKI